MAANALASLLLDRFVSASSADDAHSSLESILQALEANRKPSSANKDDEDEQQPTKLAPEMIWSDPDMLSALRHVLHTGKHKQNDMEVPLDEGASLVCKIYMEMVEQEAHKSPLLDKDEALLECLIDVISSDPNDISNDDDPDATTIVSMYTRVLALQLLTKLCLKRPSKAQAQLLQAPNGLNRLGDLLQVQQEEIIRNEALLLAQVIAEWPSCAKIWMFAEVADQVILLAVEEGGLTGGNLLVQDCLDLLFRLWKHDPNLADLVFQSQTITKSLPLLLDLRQGTEFKNPPIKTKPAKKDDDLDDILKSADDKGAESKEDEVVMPRLTDAEEKVISKTLDILALLLASDGIKQSVWKRELQLCSFTWELALVAPPPPQVPFVCSVPSPRIQQKALETVALYFNDPTTLERHAGLDRLLYLVCTGGFGTSLEEKMGISQAALHVIRQTVSVESANQMLMYTLAPPMTMGDEDGAGAQPPPTVVHKLLNTVSENLTAAPGIDPERRKVFLAGALGGLSVFLTDQTSREVMLRITTGDPEAGDDPDDPAKSTAARSLVESILHAVGTMEETENPENAFLSMTLLRFLCHWTVETPSVVQTILSSNQSSIVLSALLGIKTKTQSHKKGVAVLGKLLLGLSMEYMGDDEGKCGGWTRTSIMELIGKKSGGVSKFTSSLEQFKSVNDFGDTMPWAVCNLEFKVWSQWFSSCVLLVRKRVVQELTGSGDGEDEDEDDGFEGDLPPQDGTGGNARSLQKVVYQQSKEIDELQQSLDTANSTIKTQHQELSEYKRRVESAPSQLDTMLNEYLAKIAELETTISTMEETKRSAEEQHTSEVKARDDRIATLERELEESRAREKEARDEAETVREDMESLSQAYTNLEQEFRQQQQQQQHGRQESGVSSTETTTTTSEQQAGEAEQEGTASGHSGSTEISALRAENERLRNDAQAADAWMSMAVEKMNALGQQNAGLQQELVTLRDGQAMNQQHLELQQQNQVLVGEKESLLHQQGQMQAHIDGISNENQGLRQALNQGREQYVELERQLTSTTEQLQSTAAALEEARSQAATDHTNLNDQLAKLETELETVVADRTQLLQQLDEHKKNSAEGEVQARASAQAVADYEAALTSKNDQLKELQSAMATRTSEMEAERESHSQYVETLQLSIADLQGQAEEARANVDIAKAEIESARKQGQEEVYKCESRIRELEAKQSAFSGSQGGVSEAVLKEKEEKIEALQTANDAAQAWMAKAVEHHNMLSQQHAKLGTDNEALLAQVKELSEKATQRGELTAKAKALEEEVMVNANRVRETEAMLETCKQELDRVKTELSQQQEQNRELASSATAAEQNYDQLEELRASLNGQVSACEDLRRELAAQQQGNAESSANLEAANKELAELRAKAEDDIEKLQQKVEALETALKEKGDTCDELNSLIAVERESSKSANDKRESMRIETEQLADELEVLRSKSETAEEDSQKLVELSKQLEEAREAHEQLVRSRDQDKQTIIKLNEEISSLRTASQTSAQQSLPASETPAAQAFFSAAPHSQQPTANEVFSAVASSQPAIPSGSEAAVGAHQLFASAPPTSTSVTAQDVFAVAPSNEQSAGDFFSGGPSASAVPAAPANGESMTPEVSRDELARQVEQQTHKVNQLQQQLKAAHDELEETKKLVTGKQAAETGRIAELETIVQRLQQQLKQSEDAKKEHLTMVEALTKVNNELSIGVPKSVPETNVQLEHEETKGKLAAALAKLDEHADAVVHWEERVAGLESAIKDMEVQLSEQEESAAIAIGKWQESAEALEEKNAELLSALESCGVGEEGVISREALKALHERLRETEAALVRAKEYMKSDDDILLRWQERAAELEAAGKEFGSQLSQQELEAKAAIEIWQQQCTSLEEQNKELLSKLEGSAENEAKQKVQVEELQKELQDAMTRHSENCDILEQWEQRATELETVVKDLESQLNEQEEEAQHVIGIWQQSVSALEEQKSELAQNLEASNERERNLNGQLQEAQQALAESKDRVLKGEEALASSNEANEKFQEQLEETRHALDESNQKAQEGEAALASSNEANEKLRAQLEETRQALEDRNQKVQKGDDTKKDLQARLEEAEEALRESSEKVQKGEEALAALNEAEKNLQTQLEEAQQALSESNELVTIAEEALGDAKGKCGYHAAKASDLERQLAENEEASRAKVEQLTETCATLETEKTEVARELETANASLSRLQTQLQIQQESLTEDEKAVMQWQVRVSDLEAVVKDLEEQLTEQEEEATSAIGEWQQTVSALDEQKVELEAAVSELSERVQSLEQEKGGLAQSLEAAQANAGTVDSKLKETEQLLDEAKKNLKDKEDVLEKYNGRIAELESSLESLRTKLSQKEEQQSALAQNLEASKAEIEKLQESYSSLEDQKVELVQKLEQSDENEGKLQETLKNLGDAQENASNVVHQWEERATELERVVKDLETQLNEQGEEAKNVISMWESRNAELAQSMESLEAQLGLSKATAASSENEVKALEGVKATLQARVSELETLTQNLGAKQVEEAEKAKSLVLELQGQVAELQASKGDHANALQKAKDQQLSAEEELETLQDQLKGKEQELLIARNRIDDIKAKVTSLEEQLETTKKTSRKESEEVVSLRTQISSLQQQLEKQEASLNQAGENNAHNEVAVGEWEKRANDLEATVQELQQELTDQEDEAQNAIGEWSDRVQLLEKEKADLAQSLAVALNRSKELTDENKSIASSGSQLADAKTALEEEKLVVEDLKEQVAELESMVIGLQQQLLVNEKEWSAKREELEESASQVADLETMVNGLQHQLLVNEKDATSKRDQLKESISKYEKQTSELEKQLQEARAKVGELEATIANNATSPNEIMQGDELEDVSLSNDDAQLSDTPATDGAVEAPSQVDVSGKAAELEAQVRELEEQMRTKDSEMADAVKEWQEHCHTLETQNNQVSSELEKVSKALARAREDRSNDPDYEGSAEQQIAELESTIESLEQELEEKHTEAEAAINEWQDSYGVLNARNGELEEQLTSLTGEIQSLRDTKEAVDAEMDQCKSLEAQAREQVKKLEADLAAAGVGESSNAALEAERDDVKSKLTSLEATLSEREQELNDRPTKSALEELEARCTAQDEKLSLLSSHLEEAIKDRDEALSVQKLSSESVANSKSSEDTIRELRATNKDLETQVEALTKARDESEAALETMDNSSRDVVNQWEERAKQLEEELDQQLADSHDAIASWESSHSMLQENLATTQAELQTCQADLLGLLRAQVTSFDGILAKYDDKYVAEDLGADFSDVSVLRTKCRERLDQLENLISGQDSDVNALFTEIESLRTQIQEMEGDVQAGASVELLRSQLADAKKQAADKQSSFDEMKRVLSTEQVNAAQLKTATIAMEGQIAALDASVRDERAAKALLEARIRELDASVDKERKLHTDLEAKITALEAAAKHEQLEKETLQKELQARASELESALTKEELAKGTLQGELEAKVAALEATVADEQLAKGSLQNSVTALEVSVKEEQQAKALLEEELTSVKARLADATSRESQVTSELEKAVADGIHLRESLSAKANLESSQGEMTKQELAVLQSEKVALNEEVERLTKISSELEYDLQEANNAMQVYITKEVSDKATALAAQALREQLHEIRKKADADRAAFAAEKEAKMALEDEVKRLRADLYALVDVTDQENEMYGMHALTIKATDKIHKKERNEITELRKSLSRALEELRTSRSAERDAEERAAKAAHHVVVCEQELVAAKSDMRYLIQTMDEMRQDEASRRASLEHRISTLENDHEVLQRFHTTETDSLRNELTQAVMEKDRTLQLLKDSEKNNAAMLYAASRDHTASADESAETELAKLRIEKAQLLVAAAEEGARTERRIREVIATELSSAETDILVEREKRLAAEAACDNMKLLVAELQSDVQAYREESRMGRSPGKMMVEAENGRLKAEVEKLVEESSSLRSQLVASQSAVETANYRIEKLTAECRMAQASSNRLDREIRFQTEVQAEMFRMRSTPQSVRVDDSGEEKKEKREDDIMTTVELYDKIHEQAEAMRKARDLHQSLQVEHEDLLSLLAQTEEKRQHLERALTEARGQAAVDVVNQESDQSLIAQYGHRVKVTTP